MIETRNGKGQQGYILPLPSQSRLSNYLEMFLADFQQTNDTCVAVAETHPQAGLQQKAYDLAYDLHLTSFKLRDMRSSFCKPHVFSGFFMVYPGALILMILEIFQCGNICLGMPCLRQTTAPEKQIMLYLPH